MKKPYADEFDGSLEHQFWGESSVRVAYVRKQTKNEYQTLNLARVGRYTVPVTIPVNVQAFGQATPTYPLRVQSIGSGSDNISAQNKSGSGTYYRLTVAAGAGDKTVKIVDASGNNASFVGEHIYVLRVQ